MACHAPRFCLADELLWQEPETGRPRTWDQQGKADITTWAVQSEQLVGAPPQLPGGISVHVLDLGLFIFIPMLPSMWKYIIYRVSFYWGRACQLSRVGMGL